MTSVYEKIKAIILDGYHVEDCQIHPIANLESDLHLDSLDRVEFLMTVEKEFNLIIPDEEIDNIRTMQEVVEYVQSKLFSNASNIKQ